MDVTWQDDPLGGQKAPSTSLLLPMFARCAWDSHRGWLQPFQQLLFKLIIEGKTQTFKKYLHFICCLCSPCSDHTQSLSGPFFLSKPVSITAVKLLSQEWFFPGSGEVIFLGTSLSLHILGNCLRAGSVSFMTNPFIYMEGWQFSVYPTKTFQEQPANINADVRFALSHLQGCFSHCCSLDRFLQMQPAPWVLSSVLAAARSLSHYKTKAKTRQVDFFIMLRSSWCSVALNQHSWASFR